MRLIRPARSVHHRHRGNRPPVAGRELAHDLGEIRDRGGGFASVARLRASFRELLARGPSIEARTAVRVRIHGLHDAWPASIPDRVLPRRRAKAGTPGVRGRREYPSCRGVGNLLGDCAIEREGRRNARGRTSRPWPLASRISATISSRGGGALVSITARILGRRGHHGRRHQRAPRRGRPGISRSAAGRAR